MTELDILHSIQNMHTPLFDAVMPFISSLGNVGLIWIVISIVLLFGRRTRQCGVMILISMFLCLLFGNGFLKNAICRERPCWIDSTVKLLIAVPKDYSFPSGHTMHGFAAATIIYLHHKRAGMLALVLAALIAFSRIYLFVHYQTDILGGLCIGVLMSLFVYKMWNLAARKYRNRI